MREVISKMFSFFDKKDKKVFLILLLSFFLLGFIEMISVASIAPFVAVISHPEMITTNAYLSKIYHYFSFANEKQFVLLIGSFVFVSLVLGNIFSVVTQLGLMRFGFSQCHKISTRMLKQYLLQPYSFYLNQNRSDITKNILSDVYKVVTGILINGMQSITKFIVVLFIFALLLVINWSLALFVGGVLGGAYAIFYVLLSKKLSAYGARASIINGKQYQVVTETLGAIKELKVLGREEAFLEQFREISFQYAKAESTSAIAPQTTRYIVETIAFGGILLIVLYLTSVKNDISQVLPLLALYALAGYRLLPPMQQIFVGLSLAKFYSASLNIVYEALQDKQSGLAWNEKTFRPLFFQDRITFENIAYQYPQSDKFALNNINLSISKNTTIGLVGETGSGKTTCVDILLGLFEPTQGQVCIDGLPLSEDKLGGWHRNVGYVPQTIFLVDDTIKHNIAFGVKPEEIDEAAVLRAAKLANIHHFIEGELPQGYNTEIGEGGIRLSGGQRQRIGIARALYHDPEVIVFDEATSALDGDTEQAIIQSINHLLRKKTIIIIAHRLSTVENCDQIYLFEKGKVIEQGTFSELIDKNETFRKIAKSA